MVADTDEEEATSKGWMASMNGYFARRRKGGEEEQEEEASAQWEQQAPQPGMQQQQYPPYPAAYGGAPPPPFFGGHAQQGLPPSFAPNGAPAQAYYGAPPPLYAAPPPRPPPQAPRGPRPILTGGPLPQLPAGIPVDQVLHMPGGADLDADSYVFQDNTPGEYYKGLKWIGYGDTRTVYEETPKQAWPDPAFFQDRAMGEHFKQMGYAIEAHGAEDLKFRRQDHMMGPPCPDYIPKTQEERPFLWWEHADPYMGHVEMDGEDDRKNNCQMS